MQYFNRPGRQSAFTLDMTQIKDLNLYPGIERIYFRHDAEANQLVYDLSQQGRKFLPSDSLVSVVDSIKELKQYSQRAVEKTRRDCYPEKTADELEDYTLSLHDALPISLLLALNVNKCSKNGKNGKKKERRAS